MATAQGEGIERLLVKNKKEQLDEVDGDCYRYYLLAGLLITDDRLSVC